MSYSANTAITRNLWVFLKLKAVIMHKQTMIYHLNLIIKTHCHKKSTWMGPRIIQFHKKLFLYILHASSWTYVTLSCNFSSWRTWWYFNVNIVTWIYLFQLYDLAGNYRGEYMFWKPSMLVLCSDPSLFLFHSDHDGVSKSWLIFLSGHPLPTPKS